MSREEIKQDEVWVFMGDGASHPCAVFSSRESAENWISQQLVTGVLTAYVLNKSVYDWAIEHEYFMPKREDQLSPNFVGKFSSAYAEHYHYDGGELLDE